MTDIEDFCELNTLLDEAVLGLATSLDGNLCAGDLEFLVLSAGRVHGGEEIVNQIFEDLTILDDNLGQVEISKGSHEEFVLATRGVFSLETTSLSKHGLDGSETPIVMDLLGEEGFGEGVEGHELLGEVLGLLETFSHEHVLTNEDNIGHNHGTGSEERLQVFGQLGSSSVTRVHGDEIASSHLDLNVVFVEDEHVVGGVGRVRL
jgi:hypothetical protein